jgi:hypothetical protein
MYAPPPREALRRDLAKALAKAGLALALCVLVLSDSSAFAQSQQIDPEKLPVSIGRIRLRLSEPAPKSPALKIHTTIEVVGVAPPIELWTPAEKANLARGPAPWGPPNQKDILDIVTPQEFKRYPMDLNALMQWLAERLKTE